MSELKIVEVRLKMNKDKKNFLKEDIDLELYLNMILRTSSLSKLSDVSYFIESIFSEEKENEMFLINVNIKTQAISVFNGHENIFKNNVGDIIAQSILANSAASFLVSRGKDGTTPENMELVWKLSQAYDICNMNLIDYIYKFNGEYTSFRKEKIELLPSWFKNDDIFYSKNLNIEDSSPDINVKLVENKKFDIDDVNDAVNIMAHDIASFDREAICAIFYSDDEKNIYANTCAIGSLFGSHLNAREILKVPLLAGTKNIILLHNHPSGDTKPSSSDIATTKTFIEAAAILGMEVKDHVIVGGGRYKEPYHMKNEDFFQHKRVQNRKHQIRGR